MRHLGITDLAWAVLEEAELRPLVAKDWNPGTIWALRRKCLITDDSFGIVGITDAGIALLRQREKEIAADMVAAGRPHLNNGRPPSK